MPALRTLLQYYKWPKEKSTNCPWQNVTSDDKASHEGSTERIRFTDLPSNTLDFTSTTTTTDEGSSSEQRTRDANPTVSAAEEAKELLKAQRESVNMLTLVKNRIIETFTPLTVKLKASLEKHGYVVVENFLNDPAILGAMEQEGTRMLENVMATWTSILQH